MSPVHRGVHWGGGGGGDLKITRSWSQFYCAPLFTVLSYSYKCLLQNRKVIPDHPNPPVQQFFECVPMPIAHAHSVAKWLAHLPFTSEAAGSSLSENFLNATRTQSSCEKSKSQRSAESRGFPPGTPVSSHRES